jgi:signal transduction histidine kinase
MRGLNKPPGNARIGRALLEVLTASGSASSRIRAEQALGGGSSPCTGRSGWIALDRLRDGFRAAAVSPEMARRLGRALVAPQAMGLLLRYAGIASAEKAYRRCDALLPREQPGDRFSAARIEEGRARIEFRPAAACPTDVLFCSVRLGMLEAITPLFGLLPARVTETACAHRGARTCVYEVTWGRTPRSGLRLGTLAGAVMGGGTGLGLVFLGGFAASLSGGVALLLVATGAASGRAIDLARQLDAVARGGLGQLALLEQVESVMAEKMDALAKLEGTGFEAPLLRPLGSSRLRSPANESRRSNLARRLHGSLASLQRSLDGLRDSDLESDDARAFLDECAEATREIHGIGAEVAGGEGEGAPVLEISDLAAVVRQGVVSASPRQPSSIEVAVEIEVEPAPVRCQPLLLEQVVIQLVANAVRAMGGQGTLGVELRECSEGYEVVISDDGEGLDPEILERLFDPFFKPAVGADAGLGLARCYRVVHQHGGELLVNSEPQLGTRVAMRLPAAS